MEGSLRRAGVPALAGGAGAAGVAWAEQIVPVLLAAHDDARPGGGGPTQEGQVLSKEASLEFWVRFQASDDGRRRWLCAYWGLWTERRQASGAQQHSYFFGGDDLGKFLKAIRLSDSDAARVTAAVRERGEVKAKAGSEVKAGLAATSAPDQGSGATCGARSCGSSPGASAIGPEAVPMAAPVADGVGVGAGAEAEGGGAAEAAASSRAAAPAGAGAGGQTDRAPAHTLALTHPPGRRASTLTRT